MSSEEYEHSGTWTCEVCGTEKEIQTKLDVLGFAMTHDCDEVDQS